MDKIIKKERSSNIELLRIFTMIGVIILHYNNTSIGMGLKYVDPYSINYFVLYMLESLCAPAVNIFILISGYFLCTSFKRDVIKPIKLIVQVILYNLAIDIACSVLHGNFSPKQIAIDCVPNNYFVILYSTLFIISLYYNLIVSNLSKTKFKILLISLFFLFSIWNTLTDILCETSGHEWVGLSTTGMYGSQYGYTIVQFSLMYFIGAYFRLHNPDIKYIGLKILSCCLILTAWSIIDEKIGFIKERSSWEYCNPILILEAAYIFIMFKNIKINNNRVINLISSGAFSVFLLQNNFLTRISIKDYVQSNIFIMLLSIITICVVIYALCLLIHLIYSFIMKYVYGVILSKIQIPILKIDKD